MLKSFLRIKIMNKRKVIVTGANSGIGKAAAIKFASNGFHVIMACRNVERSESAQSKIVETSGNKSVDIIEVDVSSFDSIKKFCDEYKSRFDSLDILINNAAYFEHGKKPYQLSPNGIELVFATNTFGPFLLTELLKETLARSEDPRVLNANTENIMHFLDPKRKIEFDNLKGEFKDSRSYSVYKMYGDSKMALLLLTLKMSEVYASNGIKVNSVIIPGVKIERSTMKKMSAGYRILAMIKQPFSLEPAKLGECYYKVCTSEEFKNVTGKAVNAKCKILPLAKHDKGFGKIKELLSFGYIPKYAYDKANINRMWELSLEIISKYKN